MFVLINKIFIILLVFLLLIILKYHYGTFRLRKPNSWYSAKDIIVSYFLL